MPTNYDSGYAIAAAVQERAGMGTDAIKEKTKRYVLRSYYELLAKEPWPWALKSTPGIINTVDYIDDSITATEGSASATITTSAVTNDLTGYKVYHNTSQKIYRISDHNAYVLTLDATWKEDSISVEDCTIFKDEYALAADCLKPWSFRDRTNNTPIEYDGFIGMHKEWDTKLYGGNIVHVSVTPGGSSVVFEPWLQYASTIEYIYTEVKSDLTFEENAASDVPAIPKYFRFILEDMAYLKVLRDWEDTPSVQPKIAATEREIRRVMDEMRATYIKRPESMSA